MRRVTQLKAGYKKVATVLLNKTKMILLKDRYSITIACKQQSPLVFQQSGQKIERSKFKCFSGNKRILFYYFSMLCNLG